MQVLINEDATLFLRDIKVGPFSETFEHSLISEILAPSDFGFGHPVFSMGSPLRLQR